MTNILTILTWFTNKKAYLAPYAEDDSAKKVATKLWNVIDGGDCIPFLFMVFLTALIGLYYYFPYNNKPGRHYHPRFWWGSGALALVVAFLSAIVCCCCLANGIVAFDYGLILKVALMNTVYAAGVYLALSVIINHTGKSNAYPYPF